ncbi:SBBP repeat-containing protein [Bacteroidota bacterium]
MNAKYVKSYLQIISVLIPFFLFEISISAQTLQWAENYGSTGNDKGTSVTTDVSGNVYMTGSFENTADFDPSLSSANLSSNGSKDIYIAKYTSSGSYVWAIGIGGSSTDEGYAVVVDIYGNVIVTGYFNGTADFNPGTGTYYLTSNGSSDIFIAKYSSSGNFIWAHSMGSTSWDWGKSLGVDIFGDVYFTGIFTGTVDFDPGTSTNNLVSNGNMDAFIAKFSSSGNLSWAKNIGGLSGEYSNDIHVDLFGTNLHITGSFGGTVDFDPGTGTTNLTSVGSSDVFIAKYSSSGVYMWAERIGQSSTNMGKSIDVDDNGNVYVTGTFYGTADFNPGSGTANLTSNGSVDVFIVSLNSNGAYRWAGNIGGYDSDISNGIAVDDLGNSYVIGEFWATADFDPGASVVSISPTALNDVFIGKYDTAGNYSWAYHIGGSSEDIGYDITVTDSGFVYGTGYFRTSADFDPGNGINTLTSNGICDIFLTKISSNCQVLINNNVALCPGDSVFAGGAYQTTSGVYVDNFISAVGCDSIVTTILSVGSEYQIIDSVSICEGSFYIFPDGDTAYYSTVDTSYMSTILNCDSTIITHLTVNQTYNISDSVTICNGSFYTFPDGGTSSIDSIHISMLTAINGCDSLIIIALKVFKPDTSLTQNGIMLASNNFNASYQWLDCNNNYAIIPGENSQCFTASIDGSYAVQVTENNCIDTSSCYQVTGVGIPEVNNNKDVIIYPNPNSGYFNIVSEFDNIEYEIYSIKGELIQEGTLNAYKSVVKIENCISGMYLIRVCVSDRYQRYFRIMVK